MGVVRVSTDPMWSEVSGICAYAERRVRSALHGPHCADYRKRPTPNAPLVRMASAQESSLARISSEADPNPHFSKKSPAAPKVFGQC